MAILHDQGFFKIMIIRNPWATFFSQVLFMLQNSQAVYCVEKLGIDINKVNPKGGAIAIGHPLGATGARQVSTLLTELRRTKKKLGVISMCVGSGMGMAAIFEAEW